MAIDSRRILGRQTFRKQLISQLLLTQFHGQPVLLEQLRSAFVSTSQRPIRDPGGRSFAVSFARTIRSHLPEFQMLKLRRPDRLPLGLLFHVAIHRIADQALRARVMQDPKKVVIFNLMSGLATHKRQWVRIVCLIQSDSLSRVERRTAIPITSAISIIAKSQPTVQDIHRLSSTPVSLWRGTRIEGHERLMRADPLNDIHGAPLTRLEVGRGSFFQTIESDYLGS